MFNLSEKKIKVLIVVPCYNEATRLPVADFLKAKDNSDLFVLFVNDGSSDKTETVIETNFKSDKGYYYLNLEKNQGKAEAVRLGMLHALNLPIINDVDYIGFFDADLATSLEEIPLFFKYQNTFYGDDQNIKAIWGSRIYRLGSKIARSYLRHLLGRVFATASYLILNLETYDSQCGAKFFKREIVKKLFEEKFISKWIFDVELYMRMKKEKWGIIEYPLKSWIDMQGSKVKLFAESFRVIRDLFKIRKYYSDSDGGNSSAS